MISCRKAAELTEKKLGDELNWFENIQLSIHRTLCSACRHYGQQTNLLDKWLRKEGAEESDNLPEKNSKALEDKILNKLKNL